MIDKIQKLLDDIHYREQHKVNPKDEGDKLAYYIGRKELIEELILRVNLMIREEEINKGYEKFFTKLKKKVRLWTKIK